MNNSVWVHKTKTLTENTDKNGHACVIYDGNEWGKPLKMEESGFKCVTKSLWFVELLLSFQKLIFLQISHPIFSWENYN